MDKLPVHPEFKPKFAIDQEVWFINSNNQAESSRVRIILFELIRDGGAEILLCSGYQLSMWEIDVSGRKVFLPCELYASKSEAYNFTTWCSVEGIDDVEWEQAIGTRSGEDIERSELECCCKGISQIRRLLNMCRDQGGLIKRDSLRIAGLLRDSGHEDILHIADKPRPILHRIFSQLGVVPALQETS